LTTGAASGTVRAVGLIAYCKAVSTIATRTGSTADTTIATCATQRRRAA